VFVCSCICLLLEKLVKGKFVLIFRKVFSFYFGRKTLFRSCEKFRNIILFVDYIKFGPQTFDWYIFCLNFFFQFYPLKFDFYINFDPYFMIVICFSLILFLIEIFYLSNLILILFIVIYFIWNNLWNCNYYYFNFIIF
jgi:hypothetical protein